MRHDPAKFISALNLVLHPPLFIPVSLSSNKPLFSQEFSALNSHLFPQRPPNRKKLPTSTPSHPYPQKRTLFPLRIFRKEFSFCITKNFFPPPPTPPSNR